MTEKQLKPGRDFWKKATSAQLRWWPDVFILVLVLVFHGILMRLCETYLGSEHVAGGIVGVLGVFLGPKWLANIQRRNLPDNPLSPPSDPVQRRLQSSPAKSKFLAVSFACSTKKSK